VDTALEEDLAVPPADVTTQACFTTSQMTTMQVRSRDEGVLAGSEVIALTVRRTADILGTGPVEVVMSTTDGHPLAPGSLIATLEGDVRTILAAERSLLNIICRLSGVATHTAQWAAALRPFGVTVLDTRKTTPGLRRLEKYAVRVGGGGNKRMGLFDVAMIKDNHIAAAGGVAAAITAITRRHPDVAIQVEVESVAAAQEACAAGARFLLCDNMQPELLQHTVDAVRQVYGRTVQIEATGRLQLATAVQYAQTGVDYLSVGALTHSSGILDLGIDAC
jgi:nicotinate-nucleotide pyrophosphorylase (carboxylating)